jgi:hypothetical protein
VSFQTTATITINMQIRHSRTVQYNLFDCASLFGSSRRGRLAPRSLLTQLDQFIMILNIVDCDPLSIHVQLLSELNMKANLQFEVICLPLIESEQITASTRQRLPLLFCLDSVSFAFHLFTSPSTRHLRLSFRPIPSADIPSPIPSASIFLSFCLSRFHSQLLHLDDLSSTNETLFGLPQQPTNIDCFRRNQSTSRQSERFAISCIFIHFRSV